MSYTFRVVFEWLALLVRSIQYAVD
jgi:hypothetical protein